MAFSFPLYSILWPSKAYKWTCEYVHIRNCNLGFVASFEDHPNNPNLSLYCDVFEVQNKCIYTE